MLFLKLIFVALSVLMSTQAARRFGHAIGGAVAGMPVIAGPITAILLIDQGAGRVQAIALAALVCLPAAIAHIVCFARLAARLPWPACLALGLGTYTLCGLALTWLALPAVAVCVLALAAPALGLLAVPRARHAPGPVAVPRSELVLRIAAAVAMAAAVIAGAGHLPASVSGMLLAVPIAGSVLPCFTLARHGARATAALMGGFVRGLYSFAAFFIALYVALDHWGRLAAFCAALLAAALVQVLRRALPGLGKSS